MFNKCLDQSWILQVTILSVVGVLSSHSPHCVLLCSSLPSDYPMIGHFASCLDPHLKPDFLHMQLKNHLHQGHEGRW